MPDADMRSGVSECIFAIVLRDSAVPAEQNRNCYGLGQKVRLPGRRTLSTISSSPPVYAIILYDVVCLPGSNVDRLEEVGYGVGQRIIELSASRDRATRRETKLVNMLQVCLPQYWFRLSADRF